MSDEKKTVGKYSQDSRIDTLLSNIIGELRQFTEEQAQNLTEMTAIGRALSAQRDSAVIFEMILKQARRFTNADGGTLYLIHDNQKELIFNVLHNDTLNSYMGGTSGNPVTLPNVPLIDDDGNPNHSNVSAYVATTGEIVNIPDVYEAEGFNFEGAKKFDAALNYRSMSMLVVPMRDHENEIIGVLQLINAKERLSKETIPFLPETVDMTAALASQAAVVITQQRLIRELKILFESFIKAIATAIDQKSKYTGGHIERVAELTMSIANKINNTNDGLFADVQFSDDELDELRIAAWMHDTGKITTPEHVVDKSNKLETVFDRVELVKTRWQAIRLSRKLEAERAKIKLLEAKCSADELKAIEEECNKDISVMDEDIDFLMVTNKGGEFLGDDKVERINNLAEKQYSENGDKHNYLSENEVYNLSIRKGTLTNEERNKMNDHATMTIKILDTLPWPKKLQNVPAIAGAHHEKLDGTGYPNGLKEEDIGLGARIMAVADIFEALSASDRPYKKPMPLSQAIKILGFMVKDHHIDGDVVDLFVQSGLCFEYADKFLKKDQIDMDLNLEKEE
ncbi:MAG: HD domain-containing phosphohydrolase [Candidatus Electryonea clarkiae]|nr:HD domain-containing phosphohydrolase [Candidatus Electryonea clarkiae]MDP8288098.1 HD domain-containing phosphohydrolase [Candidatus Electryonea clarkiae]